MWCLELSFLVLCRLVSNWLARRFAALWSEALRGLVSNSLGLLFVALRCRALSLLVLRFAALWSEALRGLVSNSLVPRFVALLSSLTPAASLLG